MPIPSPPPKRRLAILRRLLRTLYEPPEPRTFPPFTAENLPPPRGRLEVIRDDNGVLHIYAEHAVDLYAALGFAQTADRFFFIDAIRHLGAGRLSAFIGNVPVPAQSMLARTKQVANVDRFVRPFGFEPQSRADYARLEPRAQALLDAFAGGVNAALRAMHGCYPPEYLIFGAVKPWHPADCLLAARTHAFVISLLPLDNELTFDAVRGVLGDDGARRLYPEAPWDAVPVTYAARGAVPEPEPPIAVPGGGSNNWAVSGARSASGAPLVANDPHVPLVPLPTFWHHVHVECPEYRVQGGMFPGCPVFGFAHNGASAWGMTTGYRDGFDLYRVHRLEKDPSRYRTVNGHGAITKRREELPSRLRGRVAIEWEACEHGIIFPGWRHHDGVPLAVRAVPSDLARWFEGQLDLIAAQTPEAFRAALGSINDGPFDFNYVYGHRDGAIGWELVGRLPRRRGDGLFVRDAHDPDAQWDGWVSFEEMPKQRDPERGFVASANSTTDPGQHAAAFSVTHCEPRYRNDRVEALLEAQPLHTVETFAALQRDVAFALAPALRDALIAAIGEVTDNPLAARALDCLRRWDGVSAADSGGALLFALLQRDLPERLFMPLLGDDVGPRYVHGRKAIPRSHRLLLDTSDPLRADLEQAAGRSIAALVREGFLAVVSGVAAAQGTDPSAWRWGTVQRVFLALPFGFLPRVGRRFVALEGPYPGDEYTLNLARPVPLRGKLYVVAGASSRFICDLARPEEAFFAHSSGPCGDAHSAFFANLTPAWHRGEYFRSALWKAEEVPDQVEHLVIAPHG